MFWEPPLCRYAARSGATVDRLMFSLNCHGAVQTEPETSARQSVIMPMPSGDRCELIGAAHVAANPLKDQQIHCRIRLSLWQREWISTRTWTILKTRTTWIGKLKFMIKSSVENLENLSLELRKFSIKVELNLRNWIRGNFVDWNQRREAGIGGEPRNKPGLESEF
jgi:hypothetical protein